MVLLPAGSLEQHGTEAPLGCDGIIAERICSLAGNFTGCAVLPALYYGFSESHRAFPGTFSISEGTYTSMLQEIITESERNGFRKIIILSGHGGNRNSADKAIGNTKSSSWAEYLGYWQLDGVTAEEERLFGPTGHHITTSEVSMVWHILKRPIPRVFTGRYPSAQKGMSSMSPEQWRLEFPDGGVGGDMSKVSLEKGRILLEFIVDALVRKIRNLESESEGETWKSSQSRSFQHIQRENKPFS